MKKATLGVLLLTLGLSCGTEHPPKEPEPEAVAVPTPAPTLSRTEQLSESLGLCEKDLADWQYSYAECRMQLSGCQSLSAPQESDIPLEVFFRDPQDWSGGSDE